ncbi:acyl carrier protein [Rhizobium sp. C4]|uniref:acyl carrier protein n=1 Tax=Rhizobium sp. C4 TaxID=1349800 RepID=UPI001E3371D1|nr:acyl carrier protein [Rhizobium sp. C4]MCD2172420.1 acyl carrier protein [Rhizobium sp. C4]
MSQSTFARVADYIAKQTGKDASTISAETSLEDAGIDSFDFIELVFQVEEEFGIHIDHNQNDVAGRLKTVGDIAGLIDELVAAKAKRAAGNPNEAA